MTGSFKAADLTVTKTEKCKPIPAPQDLRFGTEFTDHMLTINWSKATGWAAPKITPFAPIPMHPGSSVLHYGITCFEGMKAYLGADGKGRLFRPDMNMARFARSCARLAMPEFDTKELESCIKELLKVDRAWLPPQDGYSIYIRPFAYGNNPALGLAAPSEATICVILSPVGPYYQSGLKPIELFIDELNVRAWPGGSGDSKVGYNYGPTIKPGMDAARAYGSSQVLYLLPDKQNPDKSTVAECGTMNIMFVLGPKEAGGKPELVTPPLDGTILPGVTRDSILRLTRGWGDLEVSERQLTLGELRAAHAEGRLLESFGCGTAAVVTPVLGYKRANGEVLKSKVDMTQPGGSVCAKVYEQLTKIQWGKEPQHEWSVPFE
ncbi:unnamed protein product [Pedinophyceae sp. YPF-701]|nr:unnamed protein product [Pedinophyceae sp. YPF-701]